MSAPRSTVNGTMPGYTVDLKPKYKEYVTGGSSVGPRRPDLAKGRKMGHKK
jgi:hypothetical protein